MVLRIKWNQRLFFLAYFIYMLALFTDTVNLNKNIAHNLKKSFVVLAVVLLLLNYAFYLIRNYRKFQKMNPLILLLDVMIIGFISIFSYRTLDFFLIMALLFSFNLYNIEINDLFKMTFYIVFLIAVLIMILCVLQILPDKPNITSYGQLRHSLGYTGSRYVPNNITYLAAYYYIYKEKFTKLDLVVLQLLTIFAFIICGSRNAFILTELYCLFLIIFFAKRKGADGLTSGKKKIIFSMGFCSCAVLSLVSWLLLQGYRKANPFVYSINTLLSGRILWALTNMWHKPFQFINWSSYENFEDSLLYAYDNGYYYLIARYGYLFLFIFIIIFMIFAVYLRNNGKYMALLAFSIVAVSNFVDNNFMSYSFFPYLIAGLHCLTVNITNKITFSKNKECR